MSRLGWQTRALLEAGFHCGRQQCHFSCTKRCCEHPSKWTFLQIHKLSLSSPALDWWFVTAELHVACSIISAVLTWAQNYTSAKIALRCAMKFFVDFWAKFQLLYHLKWREVSQHKLSQNFLFSWGMRCLLHPD